jgi:hypothetical protein
MDGNHEPNDLVRDTFMRSSISCWSGAWGICNHKMNSVPRNYRTQRTQSIPGILPILASHLRSALIKTQWYIQHSQPESNANRGCSNTWFCITLFIKGRHAISNASRINATLPEENKYDHMLQVQTEVGIPDTRKEKNNFPYGDSVCLGYDIASMGNRVLTFPRNVGIRSPTDATSYPRQTESSAIQLRKPLKLYIASRSLPLIGRNLPFFSCKRMLNCSLTFHKSVLALINETFPTFCMTRAPKFPVLNAPTLY